jgi:hypothetical protein
MKNRKSILEKLEQLKSFLRNYNEPYADVLEDLEEEIKSADILNLEKEKEILERLKTYMFGGMGSINDIWISKNNGHKVDDEQKANKTLEELRWQLRNAIKEETS